MPKLICTRGLPASGKSTWAKAYVKSHPHTIRINRDELRLMMFDVQFDRKVEGQITIAQYDLMNGSVQDQFDILLDNTNLNPKVQRELEAWAEIVGYDLEWKDFTDVPLSECIHRDSKRGKESVGKKVITNMHRQFLQKPPEKPVHDPSLPYAIICDIDGTLAHANGRDIYDASKAMDDILDETIADIVQAHLDRWDRVVYCSGREEIHREVTEAWLKKHNLWNSTFCSLFMRPAGDTREDGIVKTELYRNYIEGKFNVRFVLDDRQRVVDAWRDLGLKCLQVMPGDF